MFSLIMLLLAVDLLIWLTVAAVLVGMLGWHPPGWLASPIAHGINTTFAIASGAVAVALPVLLELMNKHII
jgi:hypothetical protein